MGRGSRLLISHLQMISAPLICTWFLNGASVVKLMRRWNRRRGLLSQSSCDVLLKGNYRIVPSASSLILKPDGSLCSGWEALTEGCGAERDRETKEKDVVSERLI